MNVYTKKKQKQKTNLWLPKVRMCSVTQLCLTLCDPWTIACQAPLSMAFSRQEYWSGLPFPSTGICPTQGQNPHLLHWQVNSLHISISKYSVLCKLIQIFIIFSNRQHETLRQILCRRESKGSNRLNYIPEIINYYHRKWQSQNLNRDI